MEVGEHWNMGPEGCKVLKPKGPGHLEKAESGFEPCRAPVPTDVTLTVTSGRSAATLQTVICTRYAEERISLLTACLYGESQVFCDMNGE